jgi:hypothetical protein
LHPETRPSFYVNARKNLFYCHGCGQGGDLIRFVERSQHLSFRQSLAYLRQRMAAANDSQLLEETAAFSVPILPTPHIRQQTSPMIAVFHAKFHHRSFLILSSSSILTIRDCCRGKSNWWSAGGCSVDEMCRRKVRRGRTPFERFEKVARAILSVPKAEAKAQKRAFQRAKKKRKCRAVLNDWNLGSKCKFRVFNRWIAP